LASSHVVAYQNDLRNVFRKDFLLVIVFFLIGDVHIS
jgi:hypothetical protein